ncbi:MAG: HAD family hydrolase [Runella sp.]
MNIIKNIIFDLGDVIINIDVPQTAEAFAALLQRPTEEIAELIKEHQFFKRFETGELDEIEFREQVRRVLRRPDWTDATIEEAWNALLLDIPSQRVAKIQELHQKGYRLFLLSNTNPIHVAATHQILKRATGVEKLDDLFEKLYLSYEMGVMKPDPTIYQKLLTDAGIEAAETLFLDDNADNIREAAALGIQTIHVQKPTSLVEYLKDF